MFHRVFSILLVVAGCAFPARAQNPEPGNLPAERSGKITFINITEAGAAQGFIHENRDRSFGLQTINGIAFGNRFSFGIGVGVEKYQGKTGNDQEARDLTLLPAFTDVRLYLGQGKVQPFFGQAVGYAFCLDQPVVANFFGEYDEKGGVMLNPFVGLRTNGNQLVNYTISLGYRYQDNTQEVTRPAQHNYLVYGIGTDGAQFKRFDHYLTIKFGLTF